jgi:hypothetical protein
MDEDGSAEGGRTRLARGTKPNTWIDPRTSADGTDRRSCAPLQVDVAQGTRGDAQALPASAPEAARRSAGPASVDAIDRAWTTSSGAPDAIHGGLVPAGIEDTVGGPALTHVDSRGSRPVAAGLDSRGSRPMPAAGAPGSAGRAPAQSICEAVEQLIEAREADAAIAEWMQGGG